ncbi:MAG: PAS domain-containing protein [Bacteroidia bacterium]
MDIEEEIKCQLPDFIINSNNYYVIVTDLSGYYVYVNHYFKKTFQLNYKKLREISNLTTIHPDDHDICRETVKNCLTNINNIYKVKLRKPGKNNEYISTIWEFSAFKNSQKDVIGVLCIGHNITDLESAKSEAIAFARKVDNIIEEITDGFYQLDNDWRFIKINSLTKNLLGKPKNEIIGKKIWDLFPQQQGDCDYGGYLKKASDTKRSVQFENYREDTNKWYRTTVYPSTEGLTVIFRDITETKKYIDTIKTPILS